MAQAPGETVVIDPVLEERERRVKLVIEDKLPQELRKLALDLMDSMRTNAAVPERFDAFCVQAFSKPEWAVPSSALLGELFEDDEERLAELVRVPDLVIELGAGQAVVACTVAAIWAARGEMHRLARLAESIIAAHGTMKNSAAVEVMLALAGTLAISRPARAEQLLQAAMPATTADHAEGIEDAKTWLATGKVVCSLPQDARDLWDTRLRRPRSPWTWTTEQERAALAGLAEQLTPGLPGIEKYQRIVPPSWWDLAMASAHQRELAARQEKASAVATKTSAQSAPPPSAEPRVVEDKVEMPRPVAERPPEPSRSSWNDEDMPLGLDPRASSTARVVLGWSAGVFMMALTAILAPEGVYRLAKDLRAVFSMSSPVASTETTTADAPAAPPAPTTEDKKRWREAHLQLKKTSMPEMLPLIEKVQKSTWDDCEMLLSGHTEDVSFDSQTYLEMLTWLHLDPPAEEGINSRLPRLLLERVDSDVLALWEGLVYPGSPNASFIRQTAREAEASKIARWSPQNIARLRAIGTEPATTGELSPPPQTGG